MANNRNFPTSTQDFERLIQDGLIYVDKTKLLHKLAANTGNAYYFLSRPRRFGKSLIVSTLEQIFLGNQALFQGCYIYDQIQWEKYPVLRISMDKIGFITMGLEAALVEMLRSSAEKEGISLTLKSSATGLVELIEKLVAKYQQDVVILIDEYDKPIISYIEGGITPEAEQNRTILKSFYGVLKPMGKYLRFLFITGVSKFTKVSLFSDLNNLTDLTLDERYSTICGFTEAELRHYCEGGLVALAEKEGKTVEQTVEKIRFWYDGFSWNAKDFVYNPFSTMKLMDSLHFKPYWFETATPTFLVNLISEAQTYDFSNLEVEQQVYDWHDLKNLDVISLMLQTGYLTFKEHIVDFIYKIAYPNKEVELAFSKLLLEDRLHKRTGRMAITIHDLEKAFKRDDMNHVFKVLTDLFKTLPHEFFKEGKEKTDAQGNITMTRTPVGENFYHAVIYLVFKILGISMHAEVSTQHGRIDALVETDTHIYVIEFKKNRKADAAFEQIVQNKYAEHFALSKKQIKLVGIAFNLRKRGISDTFAEDYKP